MMIDAMIFFMFFVLVLRIRTIYIINNVLN